ncbi:GNAT family N-acetyltransferase [Leptolyngbya sp. FACHB-36]|uniref:GNAT family N-acetyltransferase n=1 Tax=Leptolyngbya sp. FACHB-36 TaxID=2692808 RepID=UPI001680F2DD|nr:GNAT family N-acetyltransferase [Leptolyngbya sp. FACHB-36]MBD2021609.1 GNAT family N-acetyltransferase [Leptolyngbya sp. FACHB-36]
MLEIKPMQPHQAKEVKQVLITACQEIFQASEALIRQYDSMSDIDNVQEYYFNNKGTFLVLMDSDRVVGSGAVRRLSNQICELKRMWFLPAYRGQGLGLKMAEMLLDFARTADYQTIRLDTADAQKQAAAIRLYKKLGFYSIERYNDGPCTVFMEKLL